MTRALTFSLGIALALGGLAGAFAPRAHAQDELADPLAGLGEAEDSEGDASDEAEGESEADGEDEDEPEDSADGAADDAEPASEAEPGADPEPAVRTELAAGMGVGTRGFTRPTLQGMQELPDALFPAVDLGLRVHAWPRDGFSLEFLLRYQSSLGLTIEESPPFAFRNRVDARAERVELSAAPTFRLGDSQTAPALAFPIGFALRAFWPEVHEQMTPGYSLLGPLLRVELVLPIGDVLALRFGPELQAIIAIDESIRVQGVGSSGLAYGGEAMVQLRLGQVFAIELAYREAHAVVASAWTNRDDFEDVERFATLRLSGGY